MEAKRRKRKMANGKPYAPLGEVMDEFARRAPYYVRGATPIANFIEQQTGEGYPSGTAVGKWMYGDSHARPEHMETFARVFGLNEREKARLAYAYAFRFPAAA